MGRGRGIGVRWWRMGGGGGKRAVWGLRRLRGRRGGMRGVLMDGVDGAVKGGALLACLDGGDGGLL